MVVDLGHLCSSSPAWNIPDTGLGAVQELDDFAFKRLHATHAIIMVATSLIASKV